MTRNQLVALAGFGSAVLLAGAFGFQYIGGMAPCELCLWQRWPHAAAIAVMVVALMVPGRVLPVLGMVAALTTAGLAGFHMGVEQGWWQGLASCSGGSIAGFSTADLLNPDAAVAAPVRCDAIAWSLLGVSMAGWNMIASGVLAAIWGVAALRAR
jgi:disulfide bond formation protein DsbB